MSISGIILAAVVVGGTGLVISILLGIASEKFKVPVDEKEVAVESAFRETTVVVVDLPVVMHLLKQSLLEKLQLEHVL